MHDSPYRVGPARLLPEASEAEWHMTLFLFILSWPLGAVSMGSALALLAWVAPAAGELLLRALVAGRPAGSSQRGSSPSSSS